MKKFILTILLLVAMIIPAFSEEGTVCGNMYSYFSNEITYMVRFDSSNPELPCTTGIASLYWLNSKATYNFSINSKGFITVTGAGKFILDDTKLYFLDTTDVIFVEM